MYLPQVLGIRLFQSLQHSNFDFGGVAVLGTARMILMAGIGRVVAGKSNVTPTAIGGIQWVGHIVHLDHFAERPLAQQSNSTGH
jgi:hypothetical protein